MIQNPLKAALCYAEMGWRVFPYGEDQPWVKGGVHAASCCPETLARMFRRPSNLALACGDGSGVFALDVDMKSADGLQTLALLEDENGTLPDAPTQATPTNGGRHILFQQPEQEIRNRVGFAPGLDVRTNGGSIMLAPSSKRAGAYRWIKSPKELSPPPAPEWLLKLIAPPPPHVVERPPVRARSADRVARYVDAALDRECASLASMTANSGRNLRLFQAAANLGELVGGRLLPQHLAERCLVSAAEACGLVGEDGVHAVSATIASGMARGIAKPRILEVSDGNR